MDAQEMAERSAAEFWKADSGTRSLGIEVTRVAPGEAVASMTIGDAHLNGHGTGHGGAIYYLAVVAFGYAANTHNQRGFGTQASINYLAPAQSGDRLTAVAHERHKGGRTGLYDVDVTREDGTLVATFRGSAHSTKAAWIAEDGS